MDLFASLVDSILSERLAYLKSRVGSDATAFQFDDEGLPPSVIAIVRGLEAEKEKRRKKRKDDDGDDGTGDLVPLPVLARGGRR